MALLFFLLYLEVYPKRFEKKHVTDKGVFFLPKESQKPTSLLRNGFNMALSFGNSFEMGSLLRVKTPSYGQNKHINQSSR